MNRKMVIVGLLIVISTFTMLLLGCLRPVVMVRPPEPRVEVYGPPPYPEAVWRPGYWEHRGGDWVWISGHWARPPRPHAVWIPGHWEARRRGWVWVPGYWEYR